MPPAKAKRGRGRPPKAPADKLSAHPVTLRLPPALLERIEALVERYGTRATVVRVALVKGVRALEVERQREEG